MKIMLITKIDQKNLQLAIELSKKTADAKIILLSDAVFMISSLGEQPKDLFYILPEEQLERFEKYPSWVNILDYNGFVDLITEEETTLINL